jgi:hypothetical protein
MGVPLDLYIACGQSNQVDGGGGQLDSTTLVGTTNDTDILWWEKSGTWDFTLGQPEGGWYDSLGWTTLDQWNGYGSAIPFARQRYIDGNFATDGRKLGIFKFAWNSTGIKFRWSKTGNTPSPDSLIDKMKIEWDAAVATIEASGYTVNLRGFIGSFCEGDTLSVTEESDLAPWQALLEAFVDDLRADFNLGAGEPSMIWNQLSDYDTATYNPSRTYGWTNVRNILFNVFNADDNSVLINSDSSDRPAGDIHYSALGREQIGIEKAKAVNGESYSEATA